VPNLLFLGSNSTGLRAFATARRLGCRSTLVVPVLPGPDPFIVSGGRSAEELRRLPDGPDEVIEAPGLNDDLYELAAELHARTPFDAVLTTADEAAEYANEAALRLGLPANDRTEMHTACFKHLCRARLDEAGLPNPRTAVARTRSAVPRVAAEIGFPCVVKPVRSAGKEGAAILAGPSDALGYAGGSDGPAGPWLIEEYLDGELYSAEVLGLDGTVHLLGVTHRRRDALNPLLEAAAVFPAELDENQHAAAQRFVTELFGALRLSVGVFHVEYIHTVRGPILVEVNARIMGGSAPLSFLRVTGTDPYELLINAYLSPASVRVPDVMSGGSVAFVLGARRAGVAPADAEEGLARLAGRFDFLHQRNSIRNGKPIGAMVTNVTAVGGYCNYAESSAAAFAAYLEFISGAERTLGLPMVCP
jgi:biotin carboxylase